VDINSRAQTTGDCYMVVTGLPKVRDDHATVMVKFARACLTRMAQLLPVLSESLGGEGTIDLAMRIVLHSGPVTAGVLRGKKCLFQLFGDAVKTASRMESTGQPGRIHISNATAQELIRLGKSKWMIQRDETINVKGKGEMKTYWIVFGNVSTAQLSGPQVVTTTTTTCSENGEEKVLFAPEDEPWV
jgi:class 3 adenylate cyclase